MENLYNKYLKIKAWLYSKRPNGLQLKARPPKNYKRTFYDNFQKGLRSNEWYIGARWGRFFVHRLDFYWDKDAITINKKGINFHIIKRPKTFIKKDLPKWEQHTSLPEQWTATHMNGMISSNRLYGTNTWIEITATLPESKFQWSAFWTCGLSTWPPEIDIYEAFTKDDPKKSFEISPNIHRRITHVTTEGIGHDPIPIKNPMNREVQYAVHWTNSFVKFYYDGILIKKVTDKEFIEKLSIPQYIILNNGYRDELYGDENVESTLTVKEIKIYQAN